MISIKENPETSLHWNVAVQGSGQDKLYTKKQLRR
jgi:hypothetical protein